MKTFKEIREASDVSSSHAQHMLGNDAEKRAHSAFMQKKHGVKTTYHGSDELKYHGPKKNVKKALGTHYGGDHSQAKDDHPHIYKENVKTADKKPEIYTKPDGKKGTRMVPVDREVIKQEKTLEWLKSALAREAKKVKPRQDDMEEAYEQTMYCKKCGCERGNPDPDCSCKMENASLTDAQCYSEQSKCGSLPKKEGVKEDSDDFTVGRARKKKQFTHASIDHKGNMVGFGRKPAGPSHAAVGSDGIAHGFANSHSDAKDLARTRNKRRPGSSRVVKLKHVELKKPLSYAQADKHLGKSLKGHYHEATIQEAEIPVGKTIFTKKPEPSKKDQKTIKKIQDLMKRANEDVDEAIKHTHAAVDKKGLAIGFASHERDAKDMARRNNGKVVKLKKPMSDKKTDMMINRPFKEDVSEISKGMASRYIKKSQVSTADAAKSVERGNIDSKSPDRDIAKAGKAQAKKGIKTFINRNKGTSTAVDKLTGKAKVPAKEGMAQGIAKQKIAREKEMDARRHDRMMDRARMKDTKKKNMSELSMSMKDLTKTGLNKHASPDKDKIRKGLDALKKAGNAKADAEAGERRKKFSELSNNTMGQYVRKAADDAAKKGAAGDTKKAQARVKGVSKAMDKIDHNRLFGRQG